MHRNGGWGGGGGGHCYRTPYAVGLNLPRSSYQNQVLRAGQNIAFHAPAAMRNCVFLNKFPAQLKSFPTGSGVAGGFSLMNSVLSWAQRLTEWALYIKNIFLAVPYLLSLKYPPPQSYQATPPFPSYLSRSLARPLARPLGLCLSLSDWQMYFFKVIHI